MSAPLPCWSSTSPMITSATSTCRETTIVVHISIVSILFLPFRGASRSFHYADELRRHQRCAADQSAIHVRQREQTRRVALLHAAAVEDARSRGQFLSQERMNLLNLLRRCRPPRADRPHGFVGHNRFLEGLLFVFLHDGFKLSRDHFLGTAFFSCFQRFPEAKNRGHPLPAHGGELVG